MCPKLEAHRGGSSRARLASQKQYSAQTKCRTSPGRCNPSRCGPPWRSSSRCSSARRSTRCNAARSRSPLRTRRNALGTLWCKTLWRHLRRKPCDLDATICIPCCLYPLMRARAETRPASHHTSGTRHLGPWPRGYGDRQFGGARRPRPHGDLRARLRSWRHDNLGLFVRFFGCRLRAIAIVGFRLCSPSTAARS